MSTDTATTTSKRFVGQVKWFNNKAGYGFITMKDADGKESDIFTHYSTVQVGDAQYKYLVQGEYVEFELSDSPNENHQYQATSITGIKGGKLMCETRQTTRSTTGGRPMRRGPTGRRQYERKSSEDREKTTDTSDKDGFTKVQKRKTPMKK